MNERRSPQVSVVMRVYNGEETLAEAIESILSQSFADFELLIVDDASSDSSAEIMQRYAERDRRIRCFTHERNLGHGDAWNTGFFAAQGSYITSMDCDDISRPQRLKLQVRFLDAHPEVGALGTGFRVAYVNSSRIHFDRFMPCSHPLIVLGMYYRLALCGASVMYRRELVRAVGAVPSGSGLQDDRMLQLKLLWDLRITFANLQEILYVYRVDDESPGEQDSQNGFPMRRALWLKMLQRLQVKNPEGVLDSVSEIHGSVKLTWAERRAARRALSQIADKLVEHKLVDVSDRPLLRQEIDRLLLQKKSSPRLLQKIQHWLRYRLGSKRTGLNTP